MAEAEAEGTLQTPNFKPIQHFIAVLVTCKNVGHPSKTKTQECSQHFSHNKSKGICPEAQGQLTLQSLVAEFRYRARFYGCTRYLCEGRRSSRKWRS